MKKYILLLCFAILFLHSCYKERPFENELTQNEQNKVINNWIYRTMKMYYYWNDNISTLSLDYTLSPSEFYKTLLSPIDKYSFIYENISKDTATEPLLGTIKNFGFEYLLAFKDETRKPLVGVVLYTHAGSDAAKKGIKRGDVFFKINNTPLDVNNYTNLLASDNARFSFSRQTNRDTISFEEILFSKTLRINPILTHTTYKIEELKIGYICYNQFIPDDVNSSQSYKRELLNSFEDFKRKDINELIVDFRYNPGGALNIATLFSSLIVPQIDTSPIAFKINYNKNQNNIDSTNQIVKFSNYPNSYIGNSLKRIFFIIGNNTASASEAVINSLLPYMNVILVGTTSYGKPYGSSVFIDHYNSYNNWIIQPIIMRINNSLNEANYENGFEPDFYFNEFAYPLIELGNLEEPLLDYSISIITNNKKQINSKKHLLTKMKYDICDKKYYLSSINPL